MARALTYLQQQKARTSVAKHVTFKPDFSFFTSLILKKNSVATETSSECVCWRLYSYLPERNWCSLSCGFLCGFFYSSMYVRTFLRSTSCICWLVSFRCTSLKCIFFWIWTLACHQSKSHSLAWSVHSKLTWKCPSSIDFCIFLCEMNSKLMK